MADRYQHIVDDARMSLNSYVAAPQPTAGAREDMAKHALRLARLDAYIRAGYLDPEPEKIEPGDLPDLQSLLEIVPWQDLVSPTTLWLNPTFGRHSRRVGGADADLITGDRLLDFKATTKTSLQADLRQVLGYFILARAARLDDPTFPEVTTVGIYYARHGCLWLLPCSVLPEQLALNNIEERFFERSEEVRREAKHAAKAQTTGLDVLSASPNVARSAVANDWCDGFFALNAGNIFIGRIVGRHFDNTVCDRKGEGFITIELEEPTTGRLRERDIPLARGQIMALAITNATRVLVGHIGKVVRGTFIRTTMDLNGERFTMYRDRPPCRIADKAKRRTYVPGFTARNYRDLGLAKLRLYEEWKLEVEESVSHPSRRCTGHEDARTPCHPRKRAVTERTSSPAFSPKPTKPKAAKLKPRTRKAKPRAARGNARLQAKRPKPAGGDAKRKRAKLKPAPKANP